MPVETPLAQKDAPTDGAVFTFATGALVAAAGGSLNGWSVEFPATDGRPCYVRRATAAAITATDTIGKSEWSEAVKLVEDGANGDVPMQAFKWLTISVDTNPSSIVLPTNGNYDNGWTAFASNRPTGASQYLWMTQAVKHTAKDGTVTYDNWSPAVRISGDKGDAGEDASDREFIYIRTNTYPFDGTQPKDVSRGKVHGTGDWIPKANQYTVDDYVPEGWSDTAIAIEENNRYVYAAIRTKSAGQNQQWGDFTDAFLWSNWGHQGVDGDGVQYIYKLFDHELTDAERTSNIPAKPATKNANGEWLPISGDANWYDDPQAPTTSMPFCYCSVIKEIGGTWGNYEKLGLWSKWSDDGQNSIRLALDNEHEDFLYNDIGTLIAPNQGATSRIHLYDGQTEKTSDLTIGDGGTLFIISMSGVPVSGTGAPTISGNAQNGYVLNIPALNASSAKVVVRAVYGGLNYDAAFTANKTNQDKYDLVVSPNSIAYNPATYSAQTQKRIKIYANATDLNGTTRQATIQSSEVAGLRLYARYKASESGSITDERQVTAYETDTADGKVKFYVDITPEIASLNDDIYFELRKYSGSNYIVRDYETVEIAKAENGAGQPAYLKTQEAWSNDDTTASETTSPTTDYDAAPGQPGSAGYPKPADWQDTTPTNTNGYAYLWRRSISMVLQTDGTYAESGSWKYTRLSGANGTSINVKGKVLCVRTSSAGFPTTGVSANDLAIVKTDAQLWKRGSSQWQHNGPTASDGDSYTNGEDGHLWMWSAEANSGSGEWVDLGEFKGQNGVTYYTHIAWATSVDTTDPWIGTLPDGQISTPTVNSASDVTGGSIAPASDGSKPWMGILINTSSGADTTNWHYYTWSYTKGPEGKSVYGLQCTVSTVKLTKNYAGSVSASPANFQLKLQYNGTSQSSVPSGYALYYRRDGESWHSFSGGLNTDISVLNYIGNGAYTTLEFCLGYGTNIVCSTNLTAVWEYQRMLVPAGTYTPKEYTRTWNTTPLVLEPGSNTYWFLIADSNNTGTTSSPNYISPADSAHRSGIWQQASEFEVVLTKMLFADFARIGSAIFYGDHMFSQYLNNEFTMFLGTFYRNAQSYARVTNQSSIPVVAGTQYKISVTCSADTNKTLMAAVYYLDSSYSDDDSNWNSHAVTGGEKFSTSNNSTGTYEINFTAEYTGYVRIYAWGYGTITKIVSSTSATYDKVSPMFMNTDKVPLLETWQNDTKSTSYLNVVNIPVPLVKGRKYKLTFNGKVTGGTGAVAVYYNGDIQHSLMLYNTSFGAKSLEFTAIYTDEAYVKFKVSNTSYMLTVNSVFIQCLDPFVPTVEVNWLNGYAHYSGGRVRFNPDGSGFLAGGNVKWNSGGDVDVRGTIRSTNFFHSVCFVESWLKYSTEYFYCNSAFMNTYRNEEWISKFTLGKYYTKSQIYELIGEENDEYYEEMYPCTYDSDIVIVPWVMESTNNRNSEVYLPDAESFVGKIVEIINEDANSDMTVMAVDGGRIGATAYYSDYQGKKVPTIDTNTTTSVILKGATARFLSLYCHIQNGGMSWVWLKISDTSGKTTTITVGNYELRFVNGILIGSDLI